MNTNSTEPDYTGMTVNERLFAAGLLGQFDTAVRSRSRETLIQLLMQVNIPPAEASLTADKILASPELYTGNP